MLDISIITPSIRPSSLTHFNDYISKQSVRGLTYESIIIQESITNFEAFTFIKYANSPTILRQTAHNDCGAAARDKAIAVAQGQYLLFWDDDNIYHPHAIVSSYSAAMGHDIGVVRTKHQDKTIPFGNEIVAGQIDTMCLCVKRELALKTKWVDYGGRYSDFRYISRLLSFTNDINYSKVIIGEHVC